MLFWLISIAEVATPPAFAAFAGATSTLLARKYSIASLLVGIFAPSPIAITPFATSFLAESRLSSFCVAQGNAISVFISHIGKLPSFDSKYFAEGFLSIYSFIRPRLTSLISFISPRSIPSSS